MSQGKYILVILFRLFNFLCVLLKDLVTWKYLIPECAWPNACSCITYQHPLFTCIVLGHTHTHTQFLCLYVCMYVTLSLSLFLSLSSPLSLSLNMLNIMYTMSNTHKFPVNVQTHFLLPIPQKKKKGKKKTYTSMPRIAAMVREILCGISSALSGNSSGEALSKVSIWVKVSDVCRPRSSSTLVKYSGKDITAKASWSTWTRSLQQHLIGACALIQTPWDSLQNLKKIHSLLWPGMALRNKIIG